MLYYNKFAEVIRAMTHLINAGKVMYWGTARWSPIELMETFNQARHLQQIAPICEMGEYHWWHREKVEVYMGELYNKIGNAVSFNIGRVKLIFNQIFSRSPGRGRSRPLHLVSRQLRPSHRQARGDHAAAHQVAH